MRKKKILFVTEASFHPTGYSVYTKEVLTRLNKYEEFEVAELAAFTGPESPELKNVPASDLHKWYDKEICDKWLGKGVKYIKPIVDYKTEKEKNLKLYRKYIIH